MNIRRYESAKGLQEEPAGKYLTTLLTSLSLCVALAMPAALTAQDDAPRTTSPVQSGALSNYGTITLSTAGSAAITNFGAAGKGTSTNASNFTLTGECFTVAPGLICRVVLDLTECPAGKPAITPSIVSGACFPPREELVDTSTHCLRSFRTGGQCIAHGNPATTTSLIATPNPSNTGQIVTLTATVTPAGGTLEPSGMVTYKDGSTIIGTGMLSGLNPDTAPTTFAFLSPGTHSLTAVYAGDATFRSSTSPVYTQTVTQVATTTVLTSLPNPSNAAQNVVLTATVTSASGVAEPSSTVTFEDGGATIGTGTLSGSNPDTASTTVAFTSPGTHALTAVYAGDANFSGSSSPVDDQIVNSSGVIQTTTTISSFAVTHPTPGQLQNPMNTIHLGQTISVTVTVNTANPTSSFPTGNVQLLDNGSPYGASQLLTGSTQSQQVTFSGVKLPLGQHTITAQYVGDSAYAGSASKATAVVINDTPKPR